MKDQGLWTRNETSPLIPTDDIIQEPILEIQVNERWLVTDHDIWDAWTGLRRRNGEEFHGDVHLLSHPGETWTGSRVCSCRKCQVHVEAKYRPN